VSIAIRKAALQSALRWGQWALAAAAALMLGYCGLVLADGWLFQQRERRQLEQASRISPPASNHPPTVAAGALVGRIEIPRLGLSVIVAEGVDALTLRRAVGHIPGSAMPGQPGNVGLAGHRDTYFRPLRNIRRDDVISLTTPLGEYRYRVVSTRIVSPSGVAVLDPSVSEVLTLVTCYPFYYIGPAPGRFIVRAERIL
jgi:sortase A